MFKRKKPILQYLDRHYGLFRSHYLKGTENGFPRVAASVNGDTVNAAAVWIEFDGMSNVIAASNGLRTSIAAPTSLTVTQSTNNFNVFTEFFNTLSWTASTSPNIDKYNIYRDGVFFTAVDFFTTQIIDHNAVQNGSVTYGVAAIDTSGSVSSIATVSFP